MNKMRKPLRLFAILVIIPILLLAACSGGQTGGAQTTAAAAQTTAGQAATQAATTQATTAAQQTEAQKESAPTPGNPPLPLVDGPFTISIWAPNSANAQKTMSNFAESDYYIELERRTGISVQFTHPALGEENQSFNLLISSGDYPDIVEMAPGYTYPGGYDKSIEDGVFLKLNDLVAHYAPNYDKLLNSKAQVKKEGTTDAGNIPCFYSISVDGPQPPWLGLVVRKDWLDDLGLDLPVTYDDWHDMLVAFRDEKGAEAPMMLHYSGFPALDIFTGGFGVAQNYFQVDNVVKYGPLEPGYREYLTMMNSWYAENLVDKDFATKRDFIPSNDYTTTERTGAYYDIYFNLSVNKSRSTNPNYEAVAVPTPVKKAGDILHIRQTNTDTGVVCWAVTSNCKDPVTVVRWIDYGYSPDGEILAAYGIEGKTFEYGPDGKPAFNEFIYNNPDGLSLSEAYHKYAKHGGAVAYHWDREWAGQPKANLDCLDIWSKDNDGSYLLPPITLNTEEGTEYARIYGDIETYVSEMVVNFILGQEPLSNYDAFLTQLKNMNVDRAIELQQAALDRFVTR